MRNKAYLNKLKKYYHKIPIKLYLMDLSIESIAVYCFLASCAEDFNPSMSFVSIRLKISRKRLQRCYAELEDTNIIKCVHKGFKNTTKKFEFVPYSNWKKAPSSRSDSKE